MDMGLAKFDAVNSILIYAEDNGLMEALKVRMGERAFREMKNNPSGTSFNRIFKAVEALSLSATIVIHEFPKLEISSSRTVLSQVFRECWEACGKPTCGGEAFNK